MKIKKVVNNNIVISDDSSDKEVVVMGRGIGFQKKIGEAIDESMIEKVYIDSDELSVSKLTQLLSEIPLEHIQVANEIISFAKVSLGQKLSDKIYLTLSDHINYAIERVNEGIPIKNELLWEIKRFYNHHYLIGREALSMIQNKLGVTLPEDEAGFIALHIVNAELDMDKVSQIAEMTEVIQNILNIIKYHFNIELDEYSLNYERLITHLKFFAQRLFTDVSLDEEDDSFIFMLKEKYKEEYECTLKIRDYILKEYGRDLQENELIYLTIHIRRVRNN